MRGERDSVMHRAWIPTSFSLIIKAAGAFTIDFACVIPAEPDCAGEGSKVDRGQKKESVTDSVGLEVND